MTAKFGTSGLRGLVEDILDGTCERHVRGYVRHLIDSEQAQTGDAIYVGYDFRASSPEIADQTFQAIYKEGFIPINCGDLPTPALANYAMKNGSASIMITGSHIPADRNGIKFYRKDGEIDKNDELAISKFASVIDVNDQSHIKISSVADERAKAVSFFLERYMGLFASNIFEGKRIGVYEHSSVARDILKQILASYGAEIISLGRSETFIPVDTEAVSEDTQKKLKEWTLAHKLDAIVSTDGDADRPLLSDEHGDCVKGDVLGFITSKYLDADKLATPISSNSGIKSTSDMEVFNTRVGSPYVIEAMNEALEKGGSRVVGFEANGGFLLGSDISIYDKKLQALPTRDCILPILVSLAATFEGDLTISDKVNSCHLPITHADRIQNFPTEISKKLVTDLTNNAAIRDKFFQPFGNVEKIDTTDGLRITLDNKQIVHLRPSGNAPEMRCYTEATTFEDARALAKNVIKIVTKH